MEHRSLLSAPNFGQDIAVTFQNYQGVAGSAYVNGGIANDSAGNVYANVAYWGTGNINPNGTPYTVASATPNGVMLLAKYDSSLHLQWALDPAKYPTTNVADGNGLLFQHVFVSPGSNNVYVQGQFWGTATFPTSNGTFTVAGAGAKNFVMRVDLTPVMFCGLCRKVAATSSERIPQAISTLGRQIGVDRLPLPGRTSTAQELEEILFRTSRRSADRDMPTNISTSVTPTATFSGRAISAQPRREAPAALHPAAVA
jgi:hypothetical protein